MLSKNFFLTLAVVVSAISGQEIDFNSPNEPIKEDPYYGKVVGDLKEYNKKLEGNENKQETYQPDSRSGSRTSVSTISNSVYYASLSGASYCSNQSLSAWNCKHCNRLGKDVVLQEVLFDPNYKTRGIVTTNEKRREIVVAFRGAVNVENWAQALKFDKTSFPVAQNAAVHQGFKNVADGLQPYFNGALTKLLKNPKFKDYKVVLSGHSLGGAIALIAAVYVKQVQKSLTWDRIQVFTYGQPRVGNKEFAYWYNQLPAKVTRVVNSNDNVPHLPPMFSGYRHVFTEMYIDEDNYTHICNTNYLEDPDCSNSNVPWLAVEPHHHAWNVDLGSDYC